MNTDVEVVTTRLVLRETQIARSSVFIRYTVKLPERKRLEIQGTAILTGILPLSNTIPTKTDPIPP